MTKSTQGNYRTATVNTILTCVGVHLALLAYQTVRTGDYTIINVFNIVDLEFIFPHVVNGFRNFIFSYIVLAVVFFYFLSRTRNN